MARFLFLGTLAFAFTAFFTPDAPVSPSSAQEPESKLAKRFGYEVNLRGFPQNSPQLALQSLVKTLNEDRFDYLLAHLADPAYVDSRVADYRQAFLSAGEPGRTLLGFRRLVRETTAYFLNDPVLIKELRLFNKEAEWDVGDEKAVGIHKQLFGRAVHFRRYEDRWFMESKQR